MARSNGPPDLKNCLRSSGLDGPSLSGSRSHSPLAMTPPRFQQLMKPVLRNRPRRKSRGMRHAGKSNVRRLGLGRVSRRGRWATGQPSRSSSPNISVCGGARAGARSGAWVGRPRWTRIRAATSASVIAAITWRRPPQRPQRNRSWLKERQQSSPPRAVAAWLRRSWVSAGVRIRDLGVDGPVRKVDQPVRVVGVRGQKTEVPDLVLSAK